MSPEINSKITIGIIITNDFRAASISKEAGLDFCCWGNINITITSIS